ncbi:MAG TPA: GNAT family protein [Rubricoccaceae bacterium]|nr:GNAT family protein [Rubricoccaceae bacterium]
MTDPFGDRLPVLETPRLRLRPVGPEDADALLAVFGDEETMQYWSHAPMRDREAALAYARQIADGFASRSLFQWGITVRGEDRLIGTCTLAGWSREHRRAELGYILGREHWGQGLAAEAVSAVLRFAFGPMGLHRVEADVDPENEPSIRLLERLGFTREGFLRDRWWPYGEPRHTLLFGLLKPEAPLLLTADAP